MTPRFGLWLAALIWGSSTVPTRLLLEHFSAPLLICVELCGSALALALWRWYRGQLRLAVPRRIALLGVLDPGLAFWLWVVGFALTLASHAALLTTTQVVFNALVGMVLLQQKLSARSWVLVLVSVIGAALVSWPNEALAIGLNQLLGDGLIVLAMATAALYAAISRRLNPSGANAAAPLLAQQLVALSLTLALLPVAYWFDASTLNLPSWPWWLAAAVQGILIYSLAFGWYLKALQHIALAEIGMLLNLVPLLALLLAVVVLQESLNHLALLGGALLLLALWLWREQ